MANAIDMGKETDGISDDKDIDTDDGSCDKATNSADDEENNDGFKLEEGDDDTVTESDDVTVELVIMSVTDSKEVIVLELSVIGDDDKKAMSADGVMTVSDPICVTDNLVVVTAILLSVMMSDDDRDDINGMTVPTVKPFSLLLALSEPVTGIVTDKLSDAEFAVDVTLVSLMYPDNDTVILGLAISSLTDIDDNSGSCDSIVAVTLLTSLTDDDGIVILTGVTFVLSVIEEGKEGVDNVDTADEVALNIPLVCVMSSVIGENESTDEMADVNVWLPRDKSDGVAAVKVSLTCVITSVTDTGDRTDGVAAVNVSLPCVTTLVTDTDDRPENDPSNDVDSTGTCDIKAEVAMTGVAPENEGEIFDEDMTIEADTYVDIPE